MSVRRLWEVAVEGVADQGRVEDGDHVAEEQRVVGHAADEALGVEGQRCKIGQRCKMRQRWAEGQTYVIRQHLLQERRLGEHEIWLGVFFTLICTMK